MWQINKFPRRSRLITWYFYDHALLINIRENKIKDKHTVILFILKKFERKISRRTVAIVICKHPVFVSIQWVNINHGMSLQLFADINVTCVKRLELINYHWFAGADPVI